MQDGLLVTGADTDKEVGLTEEGEAKGLVVDAFGEFVLPGEDIGEMEAGAGGLGLEKGDLFADGEGDLVVPVREEVFQEVVGFVYANEKRAVDGACVGDGQVEVGRLWPRR